VLDAVRRKFTPGLPTVRRTRTNTNDARRLSRWSRRGFNGPTVDDNAVQWPTLNARRSTLNGSNLCGCHAGLAASLAVLLRRSAGHAVRCVVASLGLVLVRLRSFGVLMKRYNSAEHTQNVNGLFGNVKLILFFVRRCPVAWASGACWCWVWCWFVRWRCPALSGAGCWFSGGATVCAGVASSNVGQRRGCLFG